MSKNYDIEHTSQGLDLSETDSAIDRLVIALRGMVGHHAMPENEKRSIMRKARLLLKEFE